MEGNDGSQFKRKKENNQEALGDISCLLNRGDEGNGSNTFTRSEERKRLQVECKTESECTACMFTLIEKGN